ncbi:MAG: general secretion pathway protein GspD [Rhodoferax sp.]|nr:general secretion pathway protein GspD [Rhodoferax sp.]
MSASGRQARVTAQAGYRRWGKAFAVLALAAALAACAPQRIRQQADELMRTARYEPAVQALERGLVDHPDSALLRSGLVLARNEAMLRLTTEATRERAAGRFAEAEALLKRALVFDTGGKRVAALLADLAVERRQQEALAQAEALAAQQQPQTALSVINQALKDNPRHTELQGLQRRLLAEQRRSQVKAAQLGLAETRPISLDFREASLRTVLDVVTRHSGINFVFDKDIRQDVRVTLFLRAARVEDALDLIVSTHQLAKKVLDEKTVLIYPNTADKQREYQEQVVRVFHLVSAEAKGAAAFLRSMLKVREPFVDERANMVAIREPAETIELAERLIALYDTNDAEVLLELEVMEVRTTRLTDLGLHFPDTIGLTPLNPSGAAGGLTLGNLAGFNSNRVGVSVAGLMLSLKREAGDFNTLANPSIRVRNREKAKVLIGDKVPVVTATAGQGGFVADSVSYLDVGLKLDVEPTIFADDEVAIKVSLEVSSLAREVRTASGSLAYQIGTRTASTLLRLRDGETQLLAGLISRDERSSAARVPGLGDLPLAGRLFSSQRDETQRTELVLAVTPRVLRNIRRPEAADAELWVGTESMPRVRPVGGLAPHRAPNATAGGGAAASPGTGPAAVRPSATAALPSAPDAASVPPSAQPNAQVAAARGAVPAAASASMAAPSPASTPVGAATPGPGLTSPAAPTAVSLRWSAPAEAKIGETFTVALELDSSAALRGAPMHLRFTSATLQLLEIEEGDFFRQGQAGATSFTRAIDASAGAARAGVLRNQADGASGRGTAVTLRLRALAAGVGEVQLLGFEPVAAGVPVPAVPLPQPLRLNIK